MPQARYQKRIDNGKATMYLTRPVKLSSRKKLPAKPQAREQAFKMISLSTVNESLVVESPWRLHHLGSSIPTPLSSVPSGNWPLLGKVTRQGVTSAAMDKTLAKGPTVAARSGMAVEANHQVLEWIISAPSFPGKE